MKTRILITLGLISTVVLAASTFTTNYDLEKPGDGDTNWGSSYRSNLDTIDAQLFVGANVVSDHVNDPTGAHASTAISTPGGTLACTTSVNVEEYLDCLSDTIGAVVGGSAVTLNTVQTITAAKTFSSQVTMSYMSAGIVHSDNGGVLTSSSILNSDIDATAAIGRSKIAAGTASHVVINDGSGNLSSEAQLAITRGGSNKSLTLANGGVLWTDADSFEVSAAGTSGQYLKSNGAAAPTWENVDSSSDILNISFAASVGSSALTVALKDSAGSNCSATSICKVAFRSATAATGTYVQRTVTGALSVVASSGSTLGQVSAVAEYTYVYLIDNAGTVELALSSSFFDEGTRISTTAEGGAGAADSRSVMYSTTARSNVGFRLIGRILSTQATAGTWASAPSELSNLPFRTESVSSNSAGPFRIERARLNTNNPTSTCTTSNESGDWISTSASTASAAGICLLTFVSGTFSATPTCTCNAISSGAIICTIDDSAVTPSSTQIQFKGLSSTTGLAASGSVFDVICIGPK